MAEEIKAICPECNELIYIEPDESFSEDEILECPYCLSNIRVGTAILRYRNKTNPKIENDTDNSDIEFQFKNTGFGPKVRAYSCPNCGSSVNGVEGETITCAYCNSVLHIDDGIIRIKITDEAKIRQAEANERIELKKYDYLQKSLDTEAEAYAQRKKIGVILLVVGTILSFTLVGISEVLPSNYEKILSSIGAAFFMLAICGWGMTRKPKGTEKQKMADDDSSSLIKVPREYWASCHNMNYGAMREILENAGFSNINCIAMHNLKPTIIKSKKDLMVQEVLIDGKTLLTAPEMAPSDVKIVITYHSY